MTSKGQNYKALTDEARKAQAAVYLATDTPVADDLSRIIKGLADAVETLVTERDAALKTLGESRARFGDLEQRTIQAESVIQSVLAIHHEGDGEDDRGRYTVCKGCSASPYPCRTVKAIRESTDG